MKRLLATALLLAACTRREGGAGGGADSTAGIEPREVPAVAFRVPRDGGPIGVYRLPYLEPTTWGSGGRITTASRALGVDFPGRRLLYRDSAGAVTSFDLVALRERRIAPPRALAVIGSDGTVFTVDPSGAISESQPWGSRSWPGSLGRGVREIFAAPGPRLIALREAGAESLHVAAREAGMSFAREVPGAAALAATQAGDAVAFATDSAVVVLEDRRMDEPWSVRLEGRPRAVAFSPSGHRLYVALAERPALAVIDRFTRSERSAIELPGPARALRPDPWGRALLARGGEGDDTETWVVLLADGALAGRLRTGWASDLPAVSEDGVLLAREGGAVLARDVRTLDSLGAVDEGAGDLWLAGRWVPPTAAEAARQSALSSGQPSRERAGPAAPGPGGRGPTADRAGRGRGSEGLSPPTPDAREADEGRPAARGGAPASAAAEFWTQVSATRNESAARALAGILQHERHQVQVVPPQPGDDMWRVMAGPFATREAADSAGRSMDRSFWVVERGGRRP